ncbi:hypothetical protein [Synechococcus phage BUCT-ZZ01]|nr:hypothetical protein [Synechococcus phage BUCT-ZZ01]
MKVEFEQAFVPQEDAEELVRKLEKLSIEFSDSAVRAVMDDKRNYSKGWFPSRNYTPTEAYGFVHSTSWLELSWHSVEKTKAAELIRLRDRAEDMIRDLRMLITKIKSIPFTLPKPKLILEDKEVVLFKNAKLFIANHTKE